MATPGANTTNQTTTPTPTEITQLLTHSAYNPAIVPQLESYVKAQALGTVPYHLDANRTLAKLYQFFPHLSSGDDITSLILLLAVLEFPSTDFVSLSCLVPERVQGREPCATLARCAELLESCQFSEFWSVLNQVGSSDDDSNNNNGGNNNNELLRNTVNNPTIISKLRKSILHLLSLTYRTAPLKSVVLPALNMSDDVESLKNYVSGDEKVKELVDSLDGESITFVPTGDNTKRSRVFKEGVNFDAISMMMTKKNQTAATAASGGVSVVRE